MGMISGLQKFFGIFPARWLGTNQIKQQTVGLRDLIKVLFTPRKPRRIETFEQTLQRLNLSEQDIQRRQQEFQVLVKIFALLSISIFGYFIYLLARQAWWPAVGTLGITLIVIANLFRYHFWLFQIKQRRLGCTLYEWFLSLKRVN